MIKAMSGRVDGTQGIVINGKYHTIGDLFIEHRYASAVEGIDWYVELCPQFDRATHMVGMAVSDQDLANTTAPLSLAHNRLQVLRMRIRRVNNQRPRASQNQRVCAWPR